mgnify:CR=1 FL=1
MVLLIAFTMLFSTLSMLYSSLTGYRRYDTKDLMPCLVNIM